MRPGALVLFQGDSVTDADRARDDPAHLGFGFAAMVAGTLRALYPEKGLRFLNRAVAGDRVSHLAARWAEDTLALRPDVLCLLIGVNDVHLAVADPAAAPTPRAWAESFRGLLTDAKAQNPALRLVVLEPFLAPSPDKSAAWCAGWGPELARRLPLIRAAAEAADALFVPLHALFAAACRETPAETLAPDGVHPAPAGHRLIARAVLSAIDREA